MRGQLNAGSSPDRAYTTFMTVMARLDDKGLLKRRREGKTDIYRPVMSREDYLASRMVAYPFCLFDCDIPVQGAVAIVLTTAERARDLKPPPELKQGGLLPKLIMGLQLARRFAPLLQKLRSRSRAPAVKRRPAPRQNLTQYP